MAGKGKGDTSIFFQDIDSQRFTMDGERADWFELYFVKRGRLMAFLGDVSVEAQAGTALWIPSGSVRFLEIANRRMFEGIQVGFSPSLWTSDVLKLPEMRVVSGFVEDADNALLVTLADVDRAASRFNSIRRANGALRIARFWVTIELIASSRRTQVADRQSVAKRQAAIDLSRLARIENLVTERIDSRLGRDEAAELVGMESAAFSRFFRAAKGVTFSDYLASVRVRQAAKLLGNRRDLKIGDVARMTGFKSLSAFHNQFRKRLGTTPDAYRRAANTETALP